MSFMLVKKAIHTNGLNKAEKMVLIVIADHADTHGTNSWPSISTIAKKSVCNRNTVVNSIKSLESKGLLKKKRRSVDGKSISNLYSVHIPDSVMGQSEYPGVSGSNQGGSNEIHEQTQEHINNISIQPREVEQEMSRKKSPQRPIPEDFWPNESAYEYAKEHLGDRLTADYVAHFTDHWLANGEHRADWNASFRNWVRNDLKWQGEREKKERVMNGRSEHPFTALYAKHTPARPVVLLGEEDEYPVIKQQS